MCMCVTTLLFLNPCSSFLCINWPAAVYNKCKIAYVTHKYVYWKRVISLRLCSLQDSWQETGGNNSLPNIKLLSTAISGFYATENKDSTSDHEWVPHTSGIMLQTTLLCPCFLSIPLNHILVYIKQPPGSACECLLSTTFIILFSTDSYLNLLIRFLS